MADRDQRLLWLLRHAKAVPDPPVGGADFDRPLAPRGRRDADALGRRLGAEGDRLGYPPDALPATVLCSSAARTVQTAERALAELDPAPTVVHLRSLYGASPEEVLDELRMVENGVRAAMVVGHNPTMLELVAELAAPGDAEGRRRIEECGMPTCAVAVFRLPIGRWQEVSLGHATLVDLSAPPY